MSPHSPEKCIIFLGIHPTLTQVPPIPHLVPIGVGFTKSATPIFLSFPPIFLAYLTVASPPEPQPKN